MAKWICLLASLLPALAWSAEAGYPLHEGDVIRISVWGEEALDQETRVLPDGSVSFPLVGTVRVAGLTAPEVEKTVVAALEDFIPDPHVTVIVTATDGNRVYVLGKVKNPGAVVMTAPMSVAQVLSLAGGLDKFADEDSISILRASAQGGAKLAVRYDDIISGKDLSTNQPLYAGDTLLVP